MFYIAIIRLCVPYLPNAWTAWLTKNMSHIHTLTHIQKNIYIYNIHTMHTHTHTHSVYNNMHKQHIHNTGNTLSLILVLLTITTQNNYYKISFYCLMYVLCKKKITGTKKWNIACFFTLPTSWVEVNYLMWISNNLLPVGSWKLESDILNTRRQWGIHIVCTVGELSLSCVLSW